MSVISLIAIRKEYYLWNIFEEIFSNHMADACIKTIYWTSYLKTKLIQVNFKQFDTREFSQAGE